MSPEAFAWGVHGGFGYVTRTLARELAHRGVEVSVVTQRRRGQREIEELDGFTVYGYPSHFGAPHIVRAFRSRMDSLQYYKLVNADIYHSQEASYNTIAAQSACPKKKHLITFQDPYDEGEWRRISLVEPTFRMTPSFRARLWFEQRALSSACRRATALYTQASFLSPRVKKLYGLGSEPAFLPNPVYVPRRRIRKSDTPMVCFLARWDPQKRVNLFLDLARRFPNVHFVAMGRGHDLVRDAEIRRSYVGVSNLDMTGFIDEEEKSRVLEESWALVNTSVREALPVSFLEALAHETPIISGEDPDGLTSTYGLKVVGDDYVSAIKVMLGSEDWFRIGRRGRAHVEEVYEVGTVVEQHLKAYRSAIGEE